MRALMTMSMVAALAVGTVMAQAPQGRPAAAPAAPTVVKVGDMAPDFNLQGTDGKMHKLSDYRGKTNVVLAWFPKAFTQGCTIECKSLADNGARIRQYDVTYFMASIDNIDDQTAFAKATSVALQGRNGQPTGTVVEKKEADFPMLADPTKQTAQAYGVLNQAGVANRWTFYIDKTGRITHIDTAVRPATSAEDMIAKLDELKVMRKSE